MKDSFWCLCLCFEGLQCWPENSLLPEARARMAKSTCLVTAIAPLLTEGIRGPEDLRKDRMGIPPHIWVTYLGNFKV